MAVRNIVKIDQEKCNGCGLCINACAEGAIQLIDGKARLVSEIYCDGLGACLGHCPQDAITIEQRQAADFDEKATEEHVKKIKQQYQPVGCPGMQMLNRSVPKPESDLGREIPSQLAQWPVQLKLVSPLAPYFANADLLLVADCVPFAMGDFHSSLLQGHAIAVACPKLDECGPYAQKIADILMHNEIRSLTVARMQVPCCSGLVHLAEQAIQRSGKSMDYEEIIIDLEGQILEKQMHSVTQSP